MRHTSLVVDQHNLLYLFPLAIITAEPLESTGDRILVPLVTVIGVGILLVAIFVVFVLRRKRIRNGKNINPQEVIPSVS